MADLGDFKPGQLRWLSNLLTQINGKTGMLYHIQDFAEDLALLADGEEPVLTRDTIYKAIRGYDHQVPEASLAALTEIEQASKTEG